MYILFHVYKTAGYSLYTQVSTVYTLIYLCIYERIMTSPRSITITIYNPNEVYNSSDSALIRFTYSGSMNRSAC